MRDLADMTVSTWQGCPVCHADPRVLQETVEGALMRCECGWFGWFRECWTEGAE